MNKQNRAAIYCRLSKDDEQIGDSVSIETQKMLLTSYCANQGFDIVDIYVDDGYSGLNFNRPSFKRLISDLEREKFNIVITKDLSRLGRDYIQTGYYIDVYFSTKHIRYIAVNDGIDTLSENNDIAPFKNILNDMYAKDLSRKVKSAKHQRAKNGLFISPQVPYGYKVDPYNRNKLIVDSEVAKNVKLIFELVYSGKSYSETSRLLEKQQIISPSAYKAKNGDTRFLNSISKENPYKWPYQTVKSIISNPVYVGDMVNHKVEIANYKTKERVRVPIENQIIVKNTHESIIDRSVFDAVNSPSFTRRKANHKYENIFKGLIFCAECGEEMQLIAKKLKKETVPMFRCVKHIKNGIACTHNHSFYYNDLLNEIQNQLSVLISHFFESNMYDDLCKDIAMQIYIRARELKKKQYQKELVFLNKVIKEKYSETSSNMDTSELESLYNAQKYLIKQITDNTIDTDTLSKIDTDELRNSMKEHLQRIVVDQNLLKRFIERIEIGHLEKDSLNTTIQKLKLHYRFNNYFLELGNCI